jgi:hypothetical protein
MALTASATAVYVLKLYTTGAPVVTLYGYIRVQLDILRSLRISENSLFKVVHPFNRPNLFYEVRFFFLG